MVVHLKRFRQSTKSTNKLETFVEFPLENFNMGPNMARQPAVTAASMSTAMASTSDAVTAVTTAESDGTTTTISTANDGQPSVTTNGATTAKVLGNTLFKLQIKTPIPKYTTKKMYCKTGTVLVDRLGVLGVIVKQVEL